MVYKRYIKRGGKLCGPYYYESHRDKNGKVVSKFVSGPTKNDEFLNKINPKVNRKLGKTLHGLFLLFIAFFAMSLFFFLIIGVSNFNNFTGFAIETENIEQRFDALSVDLSIKEPAKILGEIVSKNKNKRMDFDINGKNLRLYFDLLNYSEFVEGVVSKNTDFVNNMQKMVSSSANENSNFVNVMQKEESGEQTQQGGVIEQNNGAFNQTTEQVVNETPVSENETQTSLITGNVILNKKEKATQEVASKVRRILADYNNYSNNIYINVSEENKNATKKVALMIMQILADYNLCNIHNYLNFSVNKIDAEDAWVALMVMQRSEKPCLSGLLGSNPSPGATSALLTGNVIGDVVQNEKEEEIQLSLDNSEIQQTLENLDETKIEQITDDSVVSAENFDVMVSSVPNGTENSKDEYKWGYKVKLNDLKFMAKIDVTSDEKISIYNDNTLKIGRTLLSFEDLVKAGYKVRIETPALEIPVNLTIKTGNENLTIIINQTIVNVTEVNITQANQTEINVTIPSINQTENIVNVTINESNQNNLVNITDEETFVNDSEEMSGGSESESNESGGGGTTIPSEPTAEQPSIEPPVVESPSETKEEIKEEEKQEKSEEKQEKAEEKSEEKEAKTEEKTNEVPAVIETPASVEIPASTPSESAPEQPAESVGITGNMIRLIGLTGRAITGFVVGGDVEYANTYTIYIEKDFSGTNYKVGDIIDLDPTLIIIEISKAEHLDSNRNFISDIYDSVSAKDNNWSENINDNDFVRVTFEKPLTKTNDITIYARSTNISGECYDNETEILTLEEINCNIADCDDKNYYCENITESVTGSDSLESENCQDSESNLTNVMKEKARWADERGGEEIKVNQVMDESQTTEDSLITTDDPSDLGINNKKIAEPSGGSVENYNFGEINSNFKVGDTNVTEFISPSSPGPEQTPHFSVEYKSEGLGDFVNLLQEKGEEGSERKEMREKNNEKEKWSHDGVTGIVSISTKSYENYSLDNYINLSIVENNGAAAVSGIVSELPDEQYLYQETSGCNSRPQRPESSKTCYIKKWKLFKDLNKNEKVATLNSISGEIEWQMPFSYQEFDNSELNNEMYNIELMDGSELVVSKEHKVYVSHNYPNNSIISLFENTSTLVCFLNPGSLDQIGDLRFNASANIGTSLSCINFSASDLNFSNSFSETTLTNLSNSSNCSLNCSSLIFAYLNTSGLFFFNSSIAYSGVNNCRFNDLELEIISLTGFSLKNETNMFVSITNNIVYQPFSLYLFHIPSLIFLPIRMDSSVKPDSSSSFSLANISCFQDSCLALDSIQALTNADQFTSENFFISSLVFSGIDSVIDTILFSNYVDYVNKHNHVELFKPFGLNYSLNKITDEYREINDGKEIYFLNSRNEPVRVKSIEKVPYSGKIYDVDVPNDIVLIRRNNSSEIWSGNSNSNSSIEVYRENDNSLVTKFENINSEDWYKVYLSGLSDGESQDVFDLKIIGNPVMLDYIVDPNEGFTSDTNNTDEWWMFGKYLNHTAWDGVTYPTVCGLNNANNLKGSSGLATIANGYVYFLFSGTIFRANASNVSQVFENYTRPALGWGGPIYSNSSIYFGEGSVGNNLAVIQINASNVTQQIANYSIGNCPNMFVSIPIIAENYLYMLFGVECNINVTIIQVNANNVSQLINSKKYPDQTFSPSPSQIAYANGYVYYAFNRTLYQINASNLSSFKTYNFNFNNSLTFSGIAISNGYLYIGGNNTFYQFNASDITQKIANFSTADDIGGNFFSSPAVWNGYVYVGSGNNNVYQLNASDISQQNANYSTEGNILSSPTIANGYLYIGSNDNSTYQLNASNITQKIANFSTAYSFFYTPAYANGYIYIGNTDKFYQLNATNISLANVNCNADTTPPVVYLKYPPDGTLTNNATHYFTCNFTDNVQLKNSTLYIWNQSNSVVVNTTNRTITGTYNQTNISVTLPYQSNFTWNCYACDNSSNCAWNSNWTLKYDITSPSVTVNSLLTECSTGPVTFNVTLNEAGSCLYSLDSGATNVTMNSSSNMFYNSTTLGVGSYTANFYCNDSSGNRNDSMSVSFSISSSCGGGSTTGGDTNLGGGGGGVTSTKNVTNKTDKNITLCIPSWQCTNWTNCINSSQKRICSDLKKCNSGSGKPLESQSCFEKNDSLFSLKGIICNGWGKCEGSYNPKDIFNNNVFLKGVKKRLCRSILNPLYRFYEYQDCPIKNPITIKKTFRCNKYYLEAYDEKGNLVSRIEAIEDVKTKLNIEFALDNSNFCYYCNDKIKNYDEDGVDCSNKTGGSCPVCKITPPIKCYKDLDCGNSSEPVCKGFNSCMRIPKCTYPGTIRAKCSFTEKCTNCISGCANGNCSIKCYQDIDCGNSSEPVCKGSRLCVSVPKCTYNGTIMSRCSASEKCVNCKSGCKNGNCIGNQTIKCYRNNDCGTNGLIGEEFCEQGSKDVFQNYASYTCKSPGTFRSSCSNVTSKKIIQTCADSCFNGECLSLKCRNDLDCGTNIFLNQKFCKAKEVYDNYTIYKCNNQGTPQSSCSNLTEDRLIESCSYKCENGECLFQCKTDADCINKQICFNRECKDIICHNNSDCDDGNSHTYDVCTNSGKINSICKQENIRCINNLDCGADLYTGALFCSANIITKNYTIYTCNNPGTLQSSCSNSTVLKIIQTCADSCLNGECVGIACYVDSQCNDNNIHTQDFCVNSGTPQSTCQHNSIACFNDSECFGLLTAKLPTVSKYCDGSQLCSNQINYTCLNPGTKESICLSKNGVECIVCDNGCQDNSCLGILGNLPVTGGEGGGGIGGGCVSELTCNNWSNCINGVRNRTCANSCLKLTRYENESCLIEKITSIEPEAPEKKPLETIRELPVFKFDIFWIWFILIIFCIVLWIIIIFIIKRGKKRILIIDNSEKLKNLKNILERNNYRVITAIDKNDGYKKYISYEKPDIVIINMKALNGSIDDIITEMKSSKIFFIFSPETMNFEKNIFMKFENVVDFIEEPFNLIDFVERIKKLMRE